MQMLKINGYELFHSNCFLFLFAFLFFHGATCAAQATNFTVFVCDSRDEVANPSAFYANFNATHADLRANLSASTSSRFATAVRIQSSQPIYAIFHCRGYESHDDCLACLDDIFAISITNCHATNRATVFTDGCYLRYAAINIFSEILKPGQSVFCDGTTGAAWRSEFNTSTLQAMEDLSQEIMRQNGQFVAGKKATGGGSGDVYVAGECMPILAAADCQTCLDSCTQNIGGCLPESTDGRAVESACFMRYSRSEFFNASLLQVIDLDQRPGPGKSSKKTYVVIGATVGLAALSILLLSVFFFCCRTKEVEWVFTGDIEGLTELQSPVPFSYSELKSATRSFRDQNKLGEGGFSSVYKGILSNGKVVAVKKLLMSETDQARTDFESEVILISNIHHRNLLRLLGCCRKGPDLLLVYEFMEKGSLDQYISGDKRETLDWNKMFNIILGTARGLAYLHEEFDHCVIHRDIKPGNILLDDELLPKIADFGLARLLPDDRTHLKTRLAGTLGYTAPEYVLQGKLSEKVDVYSFGVVVLEIMSGKRCSEINIETHTTSYLLDWAWRLYESDLLMDLVDKALDTSEMGREEMKRVVETGLACTQSASKRPAMSGIVAMLLSKDHPKFELTRPAFISNNANGTSGISYTAASNATMLASHLSGR